MSLVLHAWTVRLVNIKTRSVTLPHAAAVRLDTPHNTQHQHLARIAVVSNMAFFHS